MVLPSFWFFPPQPPPSARCRRPSERTASRPAPRWRGGLSEEAACLCKGNVEDLRGGNEGSGGES